MTLKAKALIGPLLLVVLCSCAHQPVADVSGAPGFWFGLVHGLIAPFALIAHLFDPEIRMYAFPNSGGWYDFGFFLGIGSLGGAARGGGRG
ncbi:MAG: hypothetical protein PSX79_01255 [bacterium]|nr:hypothetical protein [bacterium]